MSKARTTRSQRDPNLYPPGWDSRRAQAVIEYYDARKDQPVLDKGTVAEATLGSVWMEVPQDLVPKIRKLIARQSTKTVKAY